jgi:hypothetical protein
VLTWGDDGTARLWDASFPVPLSPDDQLLELEVRSAFRIDPHGELQRLSFDEWKERRKKLEAVLGKNKSCDNNE